MPSGSTNSAAEPLYITPLDQNGNVQPSSSISLSSWALPFPKPNYTTKQRTKKTEYQGNPEATVQKLGPSFPDTVFEGRWHHRYTLIFQNGQQTTTIQKNGGAVIAQDYAPNFQPPMTQQQANELANQGGGQTFQPAGLQPLTSGGHSALGADPTAPEILQEFFEDLATSGQECLVQWVRKTRRGVLKEFEVKPERRQDMDWRMVWEWIADEGYPVSPTVVVSRPPLDAYTTMNQHSMNLGALVTTLSTPANLAASFAGFLDNFATQVATLASAVNSVANLAFDYTAMAQHSLATLNQMSVLSAAQLSLLAYARADSSVSNNNSTNLIVFEVWRRGVMSELIATVGDAYTLAQGFANSISPALVTAWRANQQVDMRDVSVRFYNTPANWQALCDYNSLQGSQIPPGTLLLIPRL